MKSFSLSLRKPAMKLSTETRRVGVSDWIGETVAKATSSWDEPLILTPFGCFGALAGGIANSLCRGEKAENPCAAKPLQAYNVPNSSPRPSWFSGQHWSIL